jgi:hypothetical protein
MSKYLDYKNRRSAREALPQDPGGAVISKREGELLAEKDALIKAGVKRRTRSLCALAFVAGAMIVNLIYVLSNGGTSWVNRLLSLSSVYFAVQVFLFVESVTRPAP